MVWLLTILLLVSAYGWAGRLLPSREDDRLVPLLTLALSVGGLALMMFWQGLGGLRYSAMGVGIPYLALMIVGCWGAMWRGRWPLPRSWPQRAALIVLLLVSSAILFNALYWPFSRDDAVGIYHYYGVQMAQSRTLTPLAGSDTLYEAYPMLIPLNYAYIYVASAWNNEYLARLIPTLLSLGCLPGVYLLAKKLHSTTAGWAAALLVGLTPAFGTWASSGYVDLPMAFYYLLAAIFAWNLRQSNRWQDALLSGLMMGFAAFTKNAALIGILLWGVWLLWAGWRGGVRWRWVGVAGLACALVAAPWYLRNLLEAGLLIPNTAWTDQAQQTLSTALIFVTRPNIYGLTGIIILLSVAAGGITLLRQRDEATLFLLWWTLPFFAAWWLFVSYDPRFLLLFLPLLGVLAGIWLAQMWQRMGGTRWLLIAVWAVVLVLALQATWNSVEFKRELLRQPIMDDATRHDVVARDR